MVHEKMLVNVEMARSTLYLGGAVPKMNTTVIEAFALIGIKTFVNRAL